MTTRPPLRERICRLAAHGDPVTEVRLVDRARAEALGRMDIHTVGDLIAHLPFRYIDLSSVATLADVRAGSDATCVGRIHEIRVKKPKPRLTVTEVSIVDDTGVLLGVWFNQPWVKQKFLQGERVAFAGRVEFDYGLKRIVAPFVEKLGEEGDPSAAGRILPVHHTVDGLSTGWVRRLVACALEDYGDVCDHLPWSVRSRHDLIPLSRALRDVHFPPDLAAARAARRRLAYDELLLLQLYMALRRYALTRERAGIAHRTDGPFFTRLVSRLEVVPTADQERAIREIIDDMARPEPMNRLLLGDVGTGKTLVATHALAAVADSGGQAAMMAPTEVLARQYAARVGPLLDDIGVFWALLTGSTTAATRREVLARVRDGEVQVLFGTHALLEEAVAFERLTLAIVDEQHRFGVNQRLGLRAKGAASDLLVMTATPIPRSLALTLYGDLATSYLRVRPNTAPPTVTTLVKPHQAAPAYEAVRTAVAAGRQAYVICSLVDESDVTGAKAATREAKRLATQVFPDLRVGLLTGRMLPADKVRTMEAFVSGDLDVLVSTTVVEVGVDVPNATIMIVENAERFGLAQLHQLRGRVGRGEHPGEMWLVADARSQESRERLAALVGSTDGFELAERDLRLRGEGHVLGDKQHGFADLRVASLLDDLDLVEAARHDAFEIVAASPRLSDDEYLPLLAAVRVAYERAWEWVSSG